MGTTFSDQNDIAGESIKSGKSPKSPSSVTSSVKSKGSTAPKEITPHDLYKFRERLTSQKSHLQERRNSVDSKVQMMKRMDNVKADYNAEEQSRWELILQSIESQLAKVSVTLHSFDNHDDQPSFLRRWMRGYLREGDDISKLSSGFVKYIRIPPEIIAQEKELPIHPYTSPNPSMVQLEEKGILSEKASIYWTELPPVLSASALLGGQEAEEDGHKSNGDLSSLLPSTAFIVKLANFITKEKFEHELPNEYLGRTGIPPNLLGLVPIIFWMEPVVGNSSEFHWARLLDNGQWIEKRGRNGIYIWKNSQSLISDCERLGYHNPVFASFMTTKSD